MSEQQRGFKDHFSGHAREYARFRPRYPAELFRLLAAEAPDRRLAWDAGTGNGQAAVALGAWFERVVGTDASAEQLQHAEVHPAVTYRQARERDSGLQAGTVDLVTVAQALHWFDLESFWREVRRVLRPDGLVAVWSYALARIDPVVDDAVYRFYRDVVGPYWAPERRHTMNGYRELSFPFRAIELPPVSMERELSVGAFCSYVATWSAVRRYLRERGEDPVAALRAQLEPLWGGEPRVVRWPLHVRAGRP